MELALKYGVKKVHTSGVDSSEGGAVSKGTYTPEARIRRGLFKTKVLGLLNADVNACRNFLKKLGKFDLISGLWKPKRHPKEGVNPPEARITDAG